MLVRAIVATATAAFAASSTADELGKLKFMSGCWEQRVGARITHEQWMSPLGGAMLGMSRTVVRDTMREYEHARIELRAGVPTYVAKPSGQAESSFGATSISDSMVVFADPAHDFPQRIIYRKVGADSMIARIEGSRTDPSRGINFPMRRVSCGG